MAVAIWARLRNAKGKAARGAIFAGRLEGCGRLAASGTFLVAAHGYCRWDV